MDDPWHALRLCDFCGGNAVAIAPKIDETGGDVKWVPVCMDHIMSWWSDEIPPEERLPAFLLPAVPERFVEQPVYETRPVRRNYWEALCRLWI